jgi:hypothetical protein
MGARVRRSQQKEPAPIDRSEASQSEKGDTPLNPRKRNKSPFKNPRPLVIQKKDAFSTMFLALRA